MNLLNLLNRRLTLNPGMVKRGLFCSLFWMFLSQFMCYWLMGRSLSGDDVFLIATYASGMLFPIVMLLSLIRTLRLPVFLTFSGLLTFFCVAWVWYVGVTLL